METKRKQIYEINKGKTCKEDGCYYSARVRGYCCNCYNKTQKDKNKSHVRKLFYRKAYTKKPIMKMEDISSG